VVGYQEKEKEKRRGGRNKSYLEKTPLELKKEIVSAELEARAAAETSWYQGDAAGKEKLTAWTTANKASNIAEQQRTFIPAT
jgi:hypothetical protein